LAMRRALEALAPGVPAYVLVGGRGIPDLGAPQAADVKGGTFVGLVAAAALVGKGEPDGLVVGADGRFPEYGFARHMGYPTPEHLAAVRRCGPSLAHRRSFAPVREAAGLGQLRLGLATAD